MNRKKDILTIFTKHETTLYSIVEIVDKLKLEQNPSHYKKIESAIRTLRMEKVIYRHKDRDSNGDLQYAAKMKASEIEPWVLNDKMSNRLKNPSRATSKNKLLSGKEIRAMFAAQYNTLAKLEDEVMKILNEYESVKKEMSKILNFIGK